MLPPNAKLARLVDATVEPLTVAEAKQYLRLETDADDSLIQDLISAARMVCEGLCDRSFVTTTWRLTLDYLPLATIGGTIGPAVFGFSWPTGSRAFDDGSIMLPMPPLISLQSILYLDQGGTTRSLDVSDGSPDVIVSPGTPGRISAGYGRFFPFTRPGIAAVAITYTAGYGPTADDVPRNIKAAVRLLVNHYYEHRSSQAPIPDAVMSLLGPSQWGAYV